MTLPDGATGYYATSNYVANGLLPWSAKKWITTGREKTILFAERPQVCRAADGQDVHNLWGVGFYSPSIPAFAVLAPSEETSTGQIAPVLPLPNEGEAIPYRIGWQKAEPQTMDDMSAVQILRGSVCDPRLPGTYHRNGMKVCMGDGSVRAFSKGTSAWIFWSACVPELSD
jgi:hypothetical protein